MKILLSILHILLFPAVMNTCLLRGQKIWSIDRCMEYAVKHNRTVRQRELETDNYQADRIKAIGEFLPGISGNVNAQYNFGRSVDPETNTYLSKSTFNNGYGLEASLSLFKGGSLINQVRQARARLLLGKAAQQEAQDLIALETFQAYIDALYYYGTLRLAQKKLAETDSLLYKTRRQEELGLKGRADVAQMEAQQATDAYNLTRQNHLFQTAALTLKQTMNFPVYDTLRLDTQILHQQIAAQIQLIPEDKDEILQYALHFNPRIRLTEMQKQVAKIEQKITWGALVPSITLFGGLSTSFYKELHKSGYPSFSNQFNHNMGSYIGISMSIPIFNRLSGIARLKQSRNQYRIASEQHEAQKEELLKLVQQALQDREGYLRESIQMEKKVASDSLAYLVTRRKFEEGLMTSLDVQHNAATLLESQTSLLQSKLIYLMKCRLVEYYKGKEIIRIK